VPAARAGGEFFFSCEDVIGLTLRWLGTRHRQKDLQLEFGAAQSTISRAIREGLRAIVQGLRGDKLALPPWPSREQRDMLVDLGQLKYGRSPYGTRPFACADGSLFLCEKPPTETLQLEMYSGKDRVHAWNCIFVVGLDGMLYASSLCWPGSTHDSVASTELFRDIRNALEPGENVYVDAGFPQWPDTYPRALSKGDKVPNNSDLNRKILRQSKHITCVRQSAEWINKSLKGEPPRAFELPVRCRYE
jgi:hypothetical protein